MRKKPERKPGHPPILSSEILNALFQAEHRPNHNQKWSKLRPDVARDALIKAEELRASELDAGDAYLQGIADLNYRLQHEQLLADVVTRFDPDAELPKLQDAP